MKGLFVLADACAAHEELPRGNGYALEKKLGRLEAAGVGPRGVSS
jgi:hypothetical protein